MRLKSGATEVALRTSQLLRAGQREAPIYEPVWYRVVLANPPTQQLTPRLRSVPIQAARSERTSDGFWNTRNRKKKTSRTTHLYRVPRISFAEDKVRDTFYKAHPWELARPRNVVEPNGLSLADCDWSQLDQPSVRLSGENVVRHTLWLAAQPEYVAENGEDWLPAYHIARHRFYRLRMREFAEHQVAAEEAAMAGAVFGESSLQRGIDAEQRTIDTYIEDAIEATKEKRARSTNVVVQYDVEETTAAADAAKEASP